MYTFDRGAPAKRARARQTVAEALETRSGVINWQVVQEFLNVAKRKFAKPMSASEATAYLDQVLLPLCEILPSGVLYSEAYSIAADAGISYYDALIVRAAQAANCRVLLSEDLQQGRRFGNLEVRNPFLKGPARWGLTVVQSAGRVRNPRRTRSAVQHPNL